MRALHLAMRSALVATSIGCAAAPAEPTMEDLDVARLAFSEARVSAAGIALLVVPGNEGPLESPEATAARAALDAAAAFVPEGCASATAEGATVRYALDGCVGSFGLVEATGVFIATYAASEEGRAVFHAESDELTLSGRAIHFVADVRVLPGDGRRLLDGTLSVEGETAGGIPVQRDGSVDAEWRDEWGCLFVGADGTVTSGERTFTSRTVDLSFCVDECPMDGGLLAWTEDARTVSIHFDGTESPEYHVGGPPSEMRLFCSP